ncbi:MAG: cytochrome C [Acidobacteria bacterium]|nr:MAG: cytochrome C [Acidobacteriota bacterium]
MARRWSEWFGSLMMLLGSNWITLLGATLTTVSGLLIVAFLILGFLNISTSPYIGIMAFLVLPGLFVFGLLLIPAGVYWERRARRKRGETEAAGDQAFPTIDFNKPRVRHLGAAVAILTVVNLLLISIVSYEAVVYMETVQFCGQVCHTVMEPEYITYTGSPHARVECVDCHIGAGAPWFVRSKLSGVGQVFAVTFNTYDRPIPVPVENLRPSRETCEECHWPQKFTGDRIRVIENFAADETNTPLTTVLLMHIGGGSQTRGIHGWHMEPGRETYYYPADRQRQTIPWVQVRQANGSTLEYRSGADEAKTPPAPEQRRLMDCIDCHNRPTHIYEDPDQAMNRALASGRISRGIAFIKKVGTEALQATELKKAGGTDRSAELERYVRDFYEKNQAEIYTSKRAEIDTAIREIQAIYRRNVFPKMNADWTTYPSNIGHERFPGCFRCHDSEHTSEGGDVIGQDCDKCHTILAQDEAQPEILKQLGIRSRDGSALQEAGGN